MGEWFVEEAVGNRGQRNYVENDEKEDRTCEKCCDAGWGNIEVPRYVDVFTRSCSEMYLIS